MAQQQCREATEQERQYTSKAIGQEKKEDHIFEDSFVAPALVTNQLQEGLEYNDSEGVSTILHTSNTVAASNTLSTAPRPYISLDHIRHTSFHHEREAEVNPPAPRTYPCTTCKRTLNSIH